MIEGGHPTPLEEARDASLFGGKAVQLGAARRAGLPVPRGLALPFRLVDALLESRPAEALSLIDAVTRDLDGPLAVRSSAAGEDSSGASFAGQHATKLGAVGTAQLYDAIRVVWTSGRSEGALAYRRRLGLDPDPKMGVVLQRLVPSDVAGVLFTRDPLTGASEHVVEASWGLGEVVVQGLVVPDRFRMGPTGDVLERVAGHKAIAIRASRECGALRESVAPHRVSTLCLVDDELASLSSLARRCDEIFGDPSDIEWALEGGAIHLLQRRPITGSKR